MLFAPIPLGSRLEAAALETDRKDCHRYGPCGVGQKALYLGGRFIDRRFYIPWKEVRRVFKRVAMSRNGFSGKGIFGSLPFLVVVFKDGTERECPFKIEADVDHLLAEVESAHPDIPTHSAAAQKKLAEAEAVEEARYLKKLSPEAEAAIQQLEADREYLEQRPALSDLLTSAARQKRIVDNMSPAFRAGGAVCGVLSVLSALYGFWGLLSHNTAGMYFLLGGAAVFFMALSANALPGRWNSRSYALSEWEAAVDNAKNSLAERPSFSLPPQYAHPVVLTRMIRVMREGRAETAAEALEIVKADLKALNSSVTVSQKEHDEVTAVKPLFLVCDYRDEI